MKIILLGYMGCGKSTIGRILAKELGICFLDLDSCIEKAEKTTVSELFKEKGEIYFRKKEAAHLRDILLHNKDFVLAVGGGTPCYAQNMKAISEITSNTIYLKLPLEELVLRLRKEKSHRPLIKSIPNEDLKDFIGKHLFERSFFYEQAAKTLKCETKSPQKLVSEIKTLLS